MSVQKEQTGSKLELSMPVQYLKGVGPARAEIFAKLGVQTVGDLLEYFPRDWVFAPNPVKISQIKADEVVTIIGLVESAEYQAWRKPQIFEISLADDSGVCRVLWFHGGFLKNQIKAGQTLIASGKVSEYKHQLQLTNPKFAVVDEKTVSAEQFSGGVYPASENLSSGQIKKIIRPVLENLDGLINEFYDKNFLKESRPYRQRRRLQVDSSAAGRGKTRTGQTQAQIRRIIFDANGSGLEAVQTAEFFDRCRDEI